MATAVHAKRVAAVVQLFSLRVNVSTFRVCSRPKVLLCPSSILLLVVAKGR